MSRRVLVIEDEPSVRNLVYILLSALQCEGDVAYNGRQALAMIRRESFDAVLLDLRCSDVPADQVLSKIKEIRPNLVGRVLFITGQVSDPQTAALIERSCVPPVQETRLMQDLWERLRSVLGPAPPLNPASAQPL